MRIFLALIILLAAGHSLFAATFVFKTGKKIEGKLLYQDRETIRIRDHSGTNISIRKILLDQEATDAANSRVVPVAAEVQPKAHEVSRPASASKTYTNASVTQVRSRRLVASVSPERLVRETRREYERLTQACRSAGGGPSRGGVLRTVTYIVHGKPVRITGYWANPADIEDAKRVCRRAIQAEQDWLSAKLNWENSRQVSIAGSTATAK